MQKILIVEDEVILAMAKEQILRKHGFETAAAHNGEQAVDMAVENPDISLILMDIDLGRGMDGTEAAQEILRNREIPIIFHTGHAEKEYVDRVKKITGYGYVMKNSGEFVLIESINMAFSLFEAKQEVQNHLSQVQEAYQTIEDREVRLRHTHRVLNSLQKVNKLITTCSNAAELTDEACRILVDTNGYHAAWIIRNENGKPIVPFSQQGLDAALPGIEKRLHTGFIPACARQAIEDEGLTIVTDPAVNCTDCPFRMISDRTSYRFDETVTLTMPLTAIDTGFGWISVMLPKFYIDNEDERTLFEEIANDLAFALQSIYSAEKNKTLSHDLSLTQTTLMTALNHSHAGIAIADAPEGRLRYVNDAGLLIRGGERGAIVNGIGIDQYVSSWHIMDMDGRPLDPDKVPLTRAVKYGEVNSRQFMIRRDNGEDRMVVANAAPIFDETGKLNSAIVIFLDVTEQWDAEKRLQESEEKYRALYDNAPLPYQSLDIDGSFIDVNPAWLRTLGYSREEVIGQRFADFLHPSWKPHFEKNFPAFKKRGYVHDVRFKIRHRNGEFRDISFEGCIGYTKTGAFRQTYCVFKDITDQKQTEDELQALRERLQNLMNTLGEDVVSTAEGNTISDIEPTEKT